MVLIKYSLYLMLSMWLTQVAWAGTLQQARQALQNGAFQKAVEQTSILLDEDADNLVIRFIQAQAYTGLEQWDKAIGLYQKILKVDAGQPGAYNNLAVIYARQGKLELARKTLELGLATSQRYKTIYDNLSAVYVEMARDAYSKALKLKLGVTSSQLGLQSLNYSTSAKPVQVAQLDLTKQKPTGQESTRPLNQPKVTHAAAVSQTTIKTATTKITPPQADTQQREPRPEPQQVASTEPKKQLPLTSGPVTAGITNTGTLNQEEVITTLQGWAAAWSAQAVDLYLSFYDGQYKPQGTSRRSWIAKRRLRLSKPKWVEVTLANFDVKQKPANHVVVRLVQEYRSDTYRDKTRKELVMKRTLDGWRILSENSLAKVR